MKLIIIALFTLTLLACNNQTNTTKSTASEITDSLAQNKDEIIEKTIQLEYSFISYFPDIVLGKDGNSDKKLIPDNVAKEVFPHYGYALNEGASEKLYAIAKIMNYKGLDLFICDYEYTRSDEESYDNHTDGRCYLLLYKNGIPLEKGEDGEVTQLMYTLNSHYYGEGGESEYLSYFDKDTTIVTYQHSSESESATGYVTPIISTKEFRSKLNEKGGMEVVEFSRIEFSSPFYDKKQLKVQNDYWAKGEEIGFRTHPTKNDKWGLNIGDIFFFESPELFTNPVSLYFYNEKENGEMTVVFESYKDEKLIGRYTVGQTNTTSLTEKDYSKQTKVLKCPVIIKTSDGDLELLPNGKFVLNNN